ncbi:MAG: IS3 family transposase [Leucobacter sp.]|jgi:putative transposase|nr:IS3 family transposase [Leucobacter sp.]
MTEKVSYLDAHRVEYGVEPICRALEGTPGQIAPSSYYAARSRPCSARQTRDQELMPEITRIHAANYGVYGVRKIHAALRREGHRVAESTVRRLMRALGLRGISRAKGPRTTKPAPETDRPIDLVDRVFTASRPNELWVADITYVKTFSGWVYTAFVLDVYSRMIIGWQVSTRLYTDLALDALRMGIWRRERAGCDLAGLKHHSDRGVQYRAIRYTERLEECAAVASVGSKGDSYDNAMAEALNSLYKAELIRNHGPWTGVTDVEISTAEWVDWYNERRLHGELDHVTPSEFEAAYRSMNPVPVLLETR